MFYVYALSSKARNYIYVGLTDNVERRFNQHNSGYEQTTRPYAPFILLMIEQFETREAARKREKYFKTAAGKNKLRVLRSNASAGLPD